MLEESPTLGRMASRAVGVAYPSARLPVNLLAGVRFTFNVSHLSFHVCRFSLAACTGYFVRALAQVTGESAQTKGDIYSCNP